VNGFAGQDVDAGDEAGLVLFEQDFLFRLK
jgi:hypothetical protein